jgi:hypothetical protein
MARRRRPVVSCCTPSTKRDAGPHERQQVRAVEPTPTSLRHVEELVGHQETLRPTRAVHAVWPIVVFSFNGGAQRSLLQLCLVHHSPRKESSVQQHYDGHHHSSAAPYRQIQVRQDSFRAREPHSHRRARRAVRAIARLTLKLSLFAADKREDEAKK